MHEHEHLHEHPHEHHTHPHHEHHAHAPEATPMEELMAMMRYMVQHNQAHAQELAQLAKQLDDAGNHAAYEEVMRAVADFDQGNARLSDVLKTLA